MLSAEMKNPANREGQNFVGSVDPPAMPALDLVLLKGLSLSEASRALGLPEDETRQKIRAEFNQLRKTPHG